MAPKAGERVYDDDGSYKEYMEDGSFFRVRPGDPDPNEAREDSRSPERGRSWPPQRTSQEVWAEEQARQAAEEEEAKVTAQQQMIKEAAEKMEKQASAQREAEEAIANEKKRKWKEREDELEKQAFNAAATKLKRKKNWDSAAKAEEEALAALMKDIESEAGVDPNAVPGTKGQPTSRDHLSLGSLGSGAGPPLPGPHSDSLRPPDFDPEEPAQDNTVTREEAGHRRESFRDDDREHRDRRRTSTHQQRRHDDGQYEDDEGEYRRRRRGADEGSSRYDTHRENDRHSRRDRRQEEDDDFEPAPRDRRRGEEQPHRSRRVAQEPKARQDERPRSGSRSVSACKVEEDDAKPKGKTGRSSSPSEKRAAKPARSGFDKKEMPPEHATVRAMQMSAGMGNPTLQGTSRVAGMPAGAGMIGPDGNPIMTPMMTPGMQANSFMPGMAYKQGMPGFPGQRPGMPPGMMGMPGMPGMGNPNPMMQGRRRPVNPGPMLHGDWTCPGCGDHVFARHYACRFCNTPRPISTY